MAENENNIFSQRWHEAMDRAYDNHGIAQQRQKKAYDKTAKVRQYDIGDHIMLRFGHQQQGKFYDIWDGPYTVTNKIGDLNNIVTRIGQQQGTNVHVNRMKPLSIIRIIQPPSSPSLIPHEPWLDTTETTREPEREPDATLIPPPKDLDQLLQDITPQPRPRGRPRKVASRTIVNGPTDNNNSQATETPPPATSAEKNKTTPASCHTQTDKTKRQKKRDLKIREKNDERWEREKRWGALSLSTT